MYSFSSCRGSHCIFFLAGVTLVLDNTLQGVNEGNSGVSAVVLCIRLTDTRVRLERSVVLLLNTMDGTAG